MQQRNQKSQQLAPTRPGLALAKLAGEDEGPPVSFEAVLGAQSFSKYLPVDEEAVNRGVEQFRRHIGKVLKHDSAELEEFIGCMGYSEEEIRKWQEEERKAEQTARRAKHLTEGAERELREAEQRRRQENFGGGTDARGRFDNQPGARPPHGVPVSVRGVPSRGPAYRMPPPQIPRGAAHPQRGPSRGPLNPPGRGIPMLRGPPLSTSAQPESTAVPTSISTNTLSVKPTEMVMRKSAAFIEKVHQEPIAVTKKELDQHNDQLEVEVAKIREQVAKELNDRYKKIMSETSTLVEVKNELARVDHVIAAEVASIREKIEIASEELNEAQNSFDDAEAEFIAAKLNKKMYEDYKAELTEYLVLLIQENQRKKTEKLEELYATLSRSSVGMTGANSAHTEGNVHIETVIQDSKVQAPVSVEVPVQNKEQTSLNVT
jgi:hypothetical protein